MTQRCERIRHKHRRKKSESKFMIMSCAGVCVAVPCLRHFRGSAPVSFLPICHPYGIFRAILNGTKESRRDDKNGSTKESHRDDISVEKKRIVKLCECRRHDTTM